MEHGHLEQGCDLLGPSKKGKDVQEDASPQRAMFIRLEGLASPSGYTFLPLS